MVFTIVMVMIMVEVTVVVEVTMFTVTWLELMMFMIETIKT